MLIKRFYAQIERWIISPRQLLRTFGADNGGAAIVVIALTLPLFIGAIGLAAEVSYWQLHHRAMQNAADAAAIAAATNNSSNYSAEGTAVASQYGFPNGQGQIVVVLSNPSTAPGCTANCYVATISDNVPMYFSQIVGYQGNDQHETTITATSVATTKEAYNYCVLALASSGAEGITSHGAPNANLNGCDTMSDSSSTCTGHNLNAGVGDAVGTNNGCGIQKHSNVAPKSDQFAQLATNIPPNNCTSYAKETLKSGPSSLPAANQLSGLDPPGNYQVMNSTGNYRVFCGDVGLTANTIINNTVLVIENGSLDTGGYTLQGSGLTIIFTGTNAGNYNHYPVDTTNGGTLDVAAPTSDTWSGVAIYQDPSLTKNVDISAAGNSPTWNISGLVYLPHSSVTLSGAVNKSGTGASCFEIVVDNITINGTGDIFANDTQCSAAGLNQTRGGNRGTLVD